MTKRFLLLACLSGASAVVLGAFGAHVLGKILTQSELQTYDTAVKYHFYHTFALLGTAILSRYVSKKWIQIAGWLFVAGIVCFSGSLYFLSVSHAFELEALNPVAGPVTPFGGLLFISGWISLAVAGMSYKHRSSHRHHSHSSSHSTEKV